ncbi:TetR/AcrR family transcriptional regulator [Rhodococcus globerulus]|uniref:Helix-turn-helix domain-containing protein n=1 Tax=Rhodococcus globerulus TaxID=33008 RepID=A0ABU4C4J6_RHOGO|nr:helix-turn-helix domain-containing protein [Rhodococcus globerulus]MDV6271412.1 helix-turn-helix domain-containing protein [Rhodococcus globerulus]
MTPRKPSTDQPTLRERQRSTVRSDLAHSAMALLDEKGWSEVTAADIAQTAGISVRTFYRHFATKSDALWPILHEHMKNQHKAFIDSDETDIVERAADALVISFESSQGGLESAHRTYRLLLGTDDLTSVWLRATVESEAGYTAAIETAFPEFSDPHEARLIAAIIVTCIRVALFDWIYDRPETLRAHAVRALDRAALRRPI